MKCLYCQCRIPKNTLTEVCENCSEYPEDDPTFYDDSFNSEIEALVNKTGVTPARFIE